MVKRFGLDGDYGTRGFLTLYILECTGRRNDRYPHTVT